MKYELVLQWPASSIKDYDEMIGIENVLIENLGDNEEIDGHDAGSGEVNIFVRTDEPKLTFSRIKSTLGSRDFWIDARIAYREVGKSDYTVLWPPSLNNFKVA